MLQVRADYNYLVYAVIYASKNIQKFIVCNSINPDTHDIQTMLDDAFNR